MVPRGQQNCIITTNYLQFFMISSLLYIYFELKSAEEDTATIKLCKKDGFNSNSS